jgi:hypothetical protein
LDSPLGTVLSDKTLPNGLHIKKVRVPLGVLVLFTRQGQMLLLMFLRFALKQATSAY